MWPNRPAQRWSSSASAIYAQASTRYGARTFWTCTTERPTGSTYSAPSTLCLPTWFRHLSFLLLAFTNVFGCCKALSGWRRKSKPVFFRKYLRLWKKAGSCASITSTYSSACTRGPWISLAAKQTSASCCSWVGQGAVPILRIWVVFLVGNSLSIRIRI